jgi:hypothetical protein
MKRLQEDLVLHQENPKAQSNQDNLFYIRCRLNNYENRYTVQITPYFDNVFWDKFKEMDRILNPNRIENIIPLNEEELLFSKERVKEFTTKYITQNHGA